MAASCVSFCRPGIWQAGLLQTQVSKIQASGSWQRPACGPQGAHTCVSYLGELFRLYQFLFLSKHISIGMLFCLGEQIWKKCELVEESKLIMVDMERSIENVKHQASSVLWNSKLWCIRSLYSGHFCFCHSPVWEPLARCECLAFDMWSVLARNWILNLF